MVGERASPIRLLVKVGIAQSYRKPIHTQHRHGTVADVQPALSFRTFLTRQTTTHIHPVSVTRRKHFPMVELNDLNKQDLSWIMFCNNSIILI
jgi:hypothetical protein